MVDPHAGHNGLDVIYDWLGLSSRAERAVITQQRERGWRTGEEEG